MSNTLPSVKVRFIDGQQDNGIQNLELPEGTTIRQVLDLQRVNLDKMTVIVKLDGARLNYDLDDEVVDGSVITVSPEQIKGA